MTQYTPVVYVKLGGKSPATSNNSAVTVTRPRCPKWWIVLLSISVLLVILAPLPFLTEIVLSHNFSPEARKMAQEPLNLSTSLNGFAMDVYAELAKKSEGQNMFFSPFSVMSAMSMTLLGCRENTHSQLSKVLRINHDNEQLKEAFSTVIEKYRSAGAEYELRTANMMYVSSQLALQQDYSDALTKSFSASAKTVDFGGQSESVRKEINEAVEKETNSKIKDLIPSGVLNSLTRLVLVNAVYFKGLWVHQFDVKHTMDKSFWLSEDNSVTVPMMFISKEFHTRVLKEHNARLLAMDYKGSNLSMVIILPDSKTGLSDLEANIGSLNLPALMQKQNKIKVDVTLPRFKLEYEQELKEVLSNLGAKDLFTAGVSDLSGIGSKPGDLFVSNVLHKAFVEVNEEGTEAAAATAAIMMTRMMIRPNPPFIADHPFMFIIYDNALNMPLFTGRVLNPSPPAVKDEL